MVTAASEWASVSATPEPGDSAPSYRTIDLSSSSSSSSSLSIAKKPFPPAGLRAYPLGTKQPLFPESQSTSPSISLSYPPSQSMAYPVAAASVTVAVPAVDDSNPFSYPPEGAMATKKEGHASQPSEKKKKRTLIIILVAAIAIIIAGGAIAAAIIITHNNNNSSPSSSVSPAASGSSSLTATTSSPTSTQTSVPDKFQIRLRDTNNCIAGTVFATCESPPGASSKQVFVKDQSAWKQVSSGGCLSTLELSSIGIDPCDYRSFQQITYLGDGTIHDSFGSCVTSTLSASGGTCASFDLLPVS
ncbi:hypothetical protein DFJ73DRAFT_797336 [Zopfochytrium polystomum]|nr:hypothetical protein DFJ73DRAFT_797336 [Zopfochytrium polystomum]